MQCDVGHLACSGCDGLLSGNQCYACSSSGGSYGRNPALEAHLRSIKIQCPYSIYGCHAYVAYCDADDHRSVCPCAPCWCPGWGQGCRFVGSPAMLLDHIAGEHPASSPVVVIRYGRELNLAVTTAERRRWHALVGEDDRSLFLVSLASSPCCSADDITTVSLVCVRANAGGGAGSRYTCRLAVELPSTGAGEEEDGGEVVVMECKVRSSALPGGSPAMDQPAFLGLHQQLQSSDTLALRVRIDKLQPVAAANNPHAV